MLLLLLLLLSQSYGIQESCYICDFQVVGMVTRKDLARYRMWTHRGQTGLEEVHISDISHEG